MMTGERFGAIFDGGTVLGLGSAELLDRFARTRDEAAFATLVARHGPMVLATCRRILPHGLDADDAFQATFLILARRAGSIHDPDRLAPWLHGVARRVATRARAVVARRQARECERTDAEADDPAEVAVDFPADDAFELRSILDEELARLPEKYRAPLVLCYLEGLTHDEAAGQLAWPVGTVRRRLAGGRDRLRSRLARRGYARADTLLILPSTVVAPSLVRSAVRVATGVGFAPSHILILTQGASTAMTLTLPKTILTAGLLAVGLVGAGVVAQQDRRESNPLGPPTAPGLAASKPAAPAVTSSFTRGASDEKLILVKNAFIANLLSVEHGKFSFAVTQGTAGRWDDAKAGNLAGKVQATGSYVFDRGNAVFQILYPKEDLLRDVVRINNNSVSGRINVQTVTNRVGTCLDISTVVHPETQSIRSSVELFADKDQNLFRSYSDFLLPIGQTCDDFSLLHDLQALKDGTLELAQPLPVEMPPILRLMFKHKSQATREYLIDVPRGAIPLSIIESDAKGALFIQTSFDDFRQLENGSWMPRKKTVYRPFDQKVRIFQITAAQTNQPPVPGDFVLQFDRAYTVPDRSQHLVYPGIRSYSFHDQASIVGRVQ